MFATPIEAARDIHNSHRSQAGRLFAHLEWPAIVSSVESTIRCADNH